MMLCKLILSYQNIQHNSINSKYNKKHTVLFGNWLTWFNKTLVPLALRPYVSISLLIKLLNKFILFFIICKYIIINFN